MTGVFISYPRDRGIGQQWAERLEDWLKTRGVPCFRDESDLDSSKPLPNELQTQIESARVVLCVVANATRDSAWVAREVTHADDYHIPIYQVLVERGATYIVGNTTLRANFTLNEQEGWQTLQRVLIDNGLAPATPTPNTTPTREAEVAYLNQLIRSAFNVTEILFAPMDAVVEDYSGIWREVDDVPFTVTGQHAFQNREVLRDDVLTAFEHSPRLAVLGPPGAGKTYALQRVAMKLARDALANPAAPIPVFVKLGDWIEPLAPRARLDEAEDPEADRSFHALINNALNKSVHLALDRLVNSHRLALLLDGLNELTSDERERRQQAVIRWIRNHRQLANEPVPVILLSCRVADFSPEIRRDLDTLALQPLQPIQILAFIRQAISRYWRKSSGSSDETAVEAADRLFWHLLPGSGYAKSLLREHLKRWSKYEFGENGFFVAEPVPAPSDHSDWHDYAERVRLRALEDPRSLLKLSERPFVLKQLIGQFQADNYSVQELSGNRVQICARFVHRMLQVEANRVRSMPEASPAVQTICPERAASALAALAWYMATQGEQPGNKTDASEQPFSAASVPYSNAIGALAQHLAVTDVAEATPDALLAFARGAQLLEVGDVVRFSHQLLQEFFTAEGLGQALERTPNAAQTLWPVSGWWDHNEWEEAMRFLALRHAGDSEWVVDALLGAQPRLMANILTGEGDWPALNQNLQQRVADRLLPMLNPATEPAIEARNAAAIALGRLGLDHRPGIGIKNGLPDIAWCEVPSGEFVFQDGETHSLPTFWMSRYSVTNAQYQCFIDDGGYSQDAWWEGLAERIEKPGASSWPEPNRPRTDVAWFEAVAFCRWLSARTRLSIRLPVELEWEKGARGSDGREYPWGNRYRSGFSNIDETYKDAGNHYLQEAAPVGLYPYPDAASSYGIEELSGQVWEWCLNAYDLQHASSDDMTLAGTESRVVRGGSWLDGTVSSSAISRLRVLPDGQSWYLGFRVLSSSPI